MRKLSLSILACLLYCGVASAAIVVNPTTGKLDVSSTSSGSGSSSWTTSGSNQYSAVAGNVGIGSTSPGKKLDVGGEFRATALSINGTGTGTLYSPNGFQFDPANSTGTSLAPQLYISTLGNVGIGGVAPSKFSVVGETFLSNIPGNSLVFDLNGDNFGAWYNTETDSTLYYGATTDKLIAPTTPIFTLATDTGNVGVGTGHPNYKLDVQGTVRATAFIGDGSGLTGVGSGSGTVTSSTVSQVARFSSTGTTVAGATNLWSDNTNVGIGTSAPTALLGVGTGNVFKVTSAGAVTGVGITNSGGYTQSGSTQNTFSGNVGIGTASPGAFSLDAVSARFTGAGNVGIGSVNPGQALDVQGTVRSTNLTITGSIINSGITSDSGKTDYSICQDTTNHQLYSGSGTLGVCLGTSSARYKRDIGSLGVGLNEIMKLKPVKFFYKDGYGDSGAKLQYGLLAEEVIGALPNLVALDIDKEPNSVDLLGTVPVLINSVKQQQFEIMFMFLMLVMLSLTLLFRKKK